MWMLSTKRWDSVQPFVALETLINYGQLLM